MKKIFNILRKSFTGKGLSRFLYPFFILFSSIALVSLTIMLPYQLVQLPISAGLIPAGILLVIISLLVICLIPLVLVHTSPGSRVNYSLIMPGCFLSSLRKLKITSWRLGSKKTKGCLFSFSLIRDVLFIVAPGRCISVVPAIIISICSLTIFKN